MELAMLLRCLSLLVALCSLAQANTPSTYPDRGSPEMTKFETEIAYFFGTPNPDAVAHHYLKAIALMNNKSGSERSKEAILAHLTDAYREVAKQTSLSFDSRKAAEHEYDLIVAQAEQKSFEDICSIMVNLYKTVFGQSMPQIEKAAMLRTFLYQYKTRLLSSGVPLSINDKALMVSMARASEYELNQLMPKP
jgi:hypothetical protein